MGLNDTDIEWTRKTVNPVVGCKKLCKQPSDEADDGKIFCYAFYQAKRQKGRCEKCYTFEPHVVKRNAKKREQMIVANSILKFTASLEVKVKEE